MNKMDIQCPFEYLACVQNALCHWLAKRPQRRYDLQYKHTVALETFVEINKQINAKFVPSPDNNSATYYKIRNNVNQRQRQSRNVRNESAFSDVCPDRT
jgi:hypothetical protein